MSFDINNFISPRNLNVLQRAGLHKVAGAMLDVPELTIKEAVAMIGAKAHLRRRETQKIATGLEDLAALTGTQIDPEVSTALRRGR